MNSRIQKLVIKVSFYLSVSLLFLLIYLVNSYYSDKYIIEKNAKDSAENRAEEITRKISEELVNFKRHVKSIADDLNNGKLDHDQLLIRLKDTYHEELHILEVGVAYVPKPPKMKRYSPHYGKIGGKPQSFTLEGAYDYTKSDWYNNTLEKNGNNWIEPYFGGATKTFVAGFSLPFYDANTNSAVKIPIGVIRINFSLEGLRDLISLSILGKRGYGFLLSKNKTFIAHPIKDYLGKNLNDLLKIDDRFKFIDLQSESFEDERTGENNWVFYNRSFLDSGWKMGIVFNEKEFLNSTKILRRQRIVIAMASIAFLFFLSVILFCIREVRMRDLWGMAISTSFLCMLGILFIWYSIVTTEGDEDSRNLILISEEDVYAAMGNFNTSYFNRKNGPNEDRISYIPTGLYVQSIEIIKANNVNITGYMWQRHSNLLLQLDLKYVEDFDKGRISDGLVAAFEKNNNLFLQDVNIKTIEKSGKWLLNKYEDKEYTYAIRKEGEKLNVYQMASGVIFPEVDTEGDKIEMVEVYNDADIKCWYFRVSLRQQSNYSKYPFDRANIWIRLWSKDYSEKGVLVLDFPPYGDFINPELKPGIEYNLVLEGWEIEHSHFSYRVRSYNTDFRNEGHVGRSLFSADLQYKSYLNKGKFPSDLKQKFVNNGIKNSRYVNIYVEEFNKRWLVIDKGHKKTYSVCSDNEKLNIFEGHKHFPELYFNIELKRNFIGPLISDMIPMIVVAFLVFSVLIISTTNKEKIGLFGFNTSAVLGYCAALFFVLIVSHVHLRENLAIMGLYYIESFYFVMYLAILAVSINSIIFASQAKFAFVQYKDNLIAKLLYWPLIQGALLGATLFTFY